MLNRLLFSAQGERVIALVISATPDVLLYGFFVLARCITDAAKPLFFNST